MCAKVTVAEGDANDLVTGPGNPHLIWDGAGARVVTEGFYRSLNSEPSWLLIMTRDDLAGLGPASFTYHPAALAGLLTIFGDDLAAGNCPCTAS